MEPSWLKIARASLGVREIVGGKNSPTIMGWIKGLGAKVLGMVVNDDETPWCGTFAAYVMTTAHYAPPSIAVRASSWAKWGRALTEPRSGAVLVFVRAGGGHVGFYVGERADAYRVLGGNQSNMVCETWVAKDRLAPGGIRWPSTAPLPAPERIMLAHDGGPVSRNEA